MILIISSDFDESTDTVMKWLLRFNKEIVRTGNFNYLSGVSLSKKEDGFNINLKLSSGINFSIDQVEAFWYRKAKFRMFDNLELNFPKDLESVTEEYRKYLVEEEMPILETFLINNLENKRHLGNYFAKNGNKISYFQEAMKAGMNIPDFIISTDINEINEELLEGSKMIKPVQDLFYSITEKETVKNYYSIEFDNSELSMFSEVIYPSMLQAYIDKKFEIRTFYLRGELYSMAIFSQNDDKTKLDFRNYNDDFPNRMIPYQMPEDMTIKIRSFMNAINLNTGSLDFIMTNKDEYFFLEVNPAGQYGMIEAHCFYSLDEKIANYLSTNYV